MATLSELRTQAKQLANMERSGFVADSEWNTYLNLSYKELYDILVSTGEDYYIKDVTFTLLSSNKYTLPSDFYKVRGVDMNISGNSDWVTIYPFNFAERNTRNTTVRRSLVGRLGTQYRILGNTLSMIPEGQADGTYRLWYIPKASDLTQDSDVVDGVNGWEYYVVVDAAIKALQKEESDYSALMMAKNDMLKRIQQMASDRDDGQGERIADVNQNLYNRSMPFVGW